ncbi:MAG: hypothetical protein ACKVX9_00195 [Blastocatellia bacterium]
MASKFIQPKSSLSLKPSPRPVSSGARSSFHFLKMLSQEPLLIVALVWAIAFLSAWFCLYYLD